MPIVTLQRRSRELGRIRLGQVVHGKGKARPEKLDRFRLTSASRDLLERVAALYGGTVSAWTPQNGGPQQWEVVTDATRLPVLVPPQPVSQYFELWSGGGCQRRCDGETELLSDKPCPCSPDPAERECKPTTRLNVVLRDVEGIGVWRLESHGYYAATELPEVAEFLARAQGYIAAYLALEERIVKRNGKTQRFMVPTLEVDITPAALMAGDGAVAPALAGPARAALPAAAAEPILDVDSLLAAVRTTTTAEELRALWSQAKAAGVLTDAVKAALQDQAAALNGTAGDPDALWQRVLASAPPDWTSQQLEDDFASVVGVDAGAATAADMQHYLQAVSTP